MQSAQIEQSHWTYLRMQQNLKYILLIIYNMVVVAYSNHNLTRYGAESILLDHLLDGYNKYTRPIYDHREPVEVKVGLYIKSLISMDDVTQTLSIMGWLDVSWKDEFMTWQPELHDNVTSLLLPAEIVWVPDVCVHNSIAENAAIVWKRVNVEYTGVINTYPAHRMDVSCRLDMTLFPFDSQSCFLTFQNQDSGGHQITFKHLRDQVLTNGSLDSTSWRITNTSCETYTSRYNPLGRDDSTSIDSVVTCTLYLQRRSLYFVLTIIFPYMILTLLSALVFVIPPQKGEKISVGISILLAFSVFQLQIETNMPKTSTSTPIYKIYMLCNIVLVALAIASATLVTVIHTGDLKWIFKRKRKGKIAKYDINMTPRKVGEPGQEVQQNNGARKCTFKSLKKISTNNADQGSIAENDEHINEVVDDRGEAEKVREIEEGSKIQNGQENEGVANYREMATIFDRALFIIWFILTCISIIACFCLLLE